jgi:hypothetical protein
MQFVDFFGPMRPRRPISPDPWAYLTFPSFSRARACDCRSTNVGPLPLREQATRDPDVVEVQQELQAVTGPQRLLIGVTTRPVLA